MDDQERENIILLLSDMFTLPKQTMILNHIPSDERQFYADRSGIPRWKLDMVFNALYESNKPKPRTLSEKRAMRRKDFNNNRNKKTKDYYATHATDRGNFKATCKNRKWNFDDFKEVFCSRTPYIEGRVRTKYYYVYKGDNNEN